MIRHDEATRVLCALRIAVAPLTTSADALKLGQRLGAHEAAVVKGLDGIIF